MALKYQQAATVLRHGGVICYPTEAVWGIGCDPKNTAALKRLLHLKQRDPDKGLILIAANMEQLSPYLEGLTDTQLTALRQSWPGPKTWVIPHNGFAHPLIRGTFKSLAVRVSAHKPVIKLCTAFGGPIVSTSANISGREPPNWPWQLRHQFGNRLDFLLHGALGGQAKPSEIRDLISGKVLRPSE